MQIKKYSEFLNETSDKDLNRLKYLDTKLKSYNRNDLMNSWQGADKTLFNEYTELDNEYKVLFDKIYGNFEQREKTKEENYQIELTKKFSKFDYNNTNIVVEYKTNNNLINIYGFNINNKQQESPIYSFNALNNIINLDKVFIIPVNTLDYFLQNQKFTIKFKQDTINAFYDVYNRFKDEYREYKSTGKISYLRDKNGKLIKY